jgi:hypothetical protein
VEEVFSRSGIKPSGHQEYGSSCTELLSSGVDMRTGSPQEEVIPAIFPELSMYISIGKKNCFGFALTSSMQRS